MTAAVLHGIQDLRVEQVPLPGDPARGEVRIRIEKVGVCGSDVHYYQHGRIGDFVVNSPMILGHECAGVVAQIGEGVTHLRVGDRVAIEPGVPRLSNAESHFHMKRGRYNLCPDIFFFATPPDHGSFCEFVNHRADFCFPLPQNVSLEEGALIEPLSTGIYAARVAPVAMGDTVVITGAGPIGLMNLLACRAAGAANIVISDGIAARLEVAERIGATRVVTGDADELQSIARELTDGRGADVCIECAGHPSALSAAIGASRAGGIVVLIGMPVGDVASININDLIVREITLRPIFRYNNTFPTGVALLSSGAVDVKPLISKRFDLQDVPAAFEYVIGNRESCVKAIVNI